MNPRPGMALLLQQFLELPEVAGHGVPDGDVLEVGEEPNTSSIGLPIITVFSKVAIKPLVPDAESPSP